MSARQTSRESAAALPKMTVTKDQLVRFNYDASNLLENQIRTVTNSGVSDPEQKLLDLFESFANDLSILAISSQDTVANLEAAANVADSILLDDLDQHAARLEAVQNAVESVKVNFESASENAVKIGDRLAISEKERFRIVTAINMTNYMKYFESQPISKFIGSFDGPQILELLPVGLKDKDWGAISQTVHDLKRILYDVNTEEFQQAQKTVIKLSEIIEEELLMLFEAAIGAVMDSASSADRKGRDAAIKSAKNLANWLHQFNGGHSLQKRFIFSVVQKRLPRESVPSSSSKVMIVPQRRQSAWSTLTGAGKSTLVNELEAAIPEGFDHDDDDEDDDDSSAGASENDSEEDVAAKTTLQRRKSLVQINAVIAATSNAAAAGSGQVLDQLSELFWTIGTVCEEQFALIRLIFPSHTITKVTRLLIQRIFNDPAFGIQARVEAVLCPKPPRPALSASDYLDALVTVREKLSSLFMILVEHCTQPGSAQGVDHRDSNNALSEAAAGRASRADSISSNESDHNMDNASNNNRSSRSSARLVTPQDGSSYSAEPEDSMHDEALRVAAEVKEFLGEQVSQVISGYLADYFERELQYVRHQFVEGLRIATDDINSLTKVSSGTLLTLPRLRAEKIKSIPALVQTVANHRYVTSVYNITTESVIRMESIGRDDKRLAMHVKDLFMLQLGFLVDGVFLPWIQACTIMLLKLAGQRSSTSSAPPMEFLSALSALYCGANKLRTQFDEVFVKSLSQIPNIMAVCKENRRRAMKSIDKGAQDALHAWTLCVGIHVERTLSSIQSKYDYIPKISATTEASVRSSSRSKSIEPTAACDAVCKALLLVSNGIRSYQNDLVGLNLMDNFWRPLGRQVIGSLISHWKKQKISIDGGKILLKDLTEYYNIMVLFEAPENIDMMMCLKEIALVYVACPEDVARIVIEGLRHLDTVIVVALVRARQDCNAKGSSDWARIISAAYGQVKWDSALPWEVKKFMSVVSFAESAAAGADSQMLGPTTLRKSSAPISVQYLMDRAKNGLPTYDNIDGKGATNAMDQLTADSLSATSSLGGNKLLGGGGRPLSQFTPSRPELAGKGQSVELNRTNSEAAEALVRPDLIGTQSKPKASTLQAMSQSSSSLISKMINRTNSATASSASVSSIPFSKPVNPFETSPTAASSLGKSGFGSNNNDTCASSSNNNGTTTGTNGHHSGGGANSSSSSGSKDTKGSMLGKMQSMFHFS